MRLALSLLALASCSHSSPPPPRVGTPAASLAAANTPVVARPLAPTAIAAPAPSAPTQLDVLFAGRCAKASVGHVGDRPAFAYDLNVVYFEGDDPRELFRTAAVAPTAYNGYRYGSIGEVGGADPTHAWIVKYAPARGDGYNGSLLFAGRKWENTLYANGPDGSNYDAEGVIEQPDGSVWSLAIEGGPSDGAPGRHFAAWSASGDLLDTHLPGNDMAGALRLASGELVVGDHGKKGQLVLRRWSPTQAVGDLSAPDRLVTHSEIRSRVGTARAVLATEAPNGLLAFYSYQGGALQRLKLPVAAGRNDSWLLTRDDTLYVAHGKDVVVHRHDGEITRETAPEPGVLGQDSVYAWWLATSGALYVHAEQGWSKVTLLDAPWVSPQHGPVTLEYVRTVGVETVVGTRHTEPGTRKPFTMRTVYSSVAHGAPARCGTPLRPGEIGRP